MPLRCILAGSMCYVQKTDLLRQLSKAEALPSGYAQTQRSSQPTNVIALSHKTNARNRGLHTKRLIVLCTTSWPDGRQSGFPVGRPATRCTHSPPGDAGTLIPHVGPFLVRRRWLILRAQCRKRLHEVDRPVSVGQPLRCSIRCNHEQAG
jgi:hypothetical protein